MADDKRWEWRILWPGVLIGLAVGVAMALFFDWAFFTTGVILAIAFGVRVESVGSAAEEPDTTHR